MRLRSTKETTDLRNDRPNRQRALPWQRGLVLVALLAGALGAEGCLSRPVEPNQTATTTAFESASTRGTDQIDLLFAIDNSQSMGDKQAILARAVPDLLDRLLTPNCIDEANQTIGKSTLDESGEARCAIGKPEFPAVQDLHVGILSSSLGGGGSNACSATSLVDSGKRIAATLNAHQNDRGHLLQRAGDEEGPVTAMGSSNYLAWLPRTRRNEGRPEPKGAPRIVDRTVLEGAFKSMIQGVHEYGCGFEAQLESVYRFLVQPDPYDTIIGGVDQRTATQLQGIDETILEQRANFLRPNSIVLVVMLTDENESNVDPLSFGGQAWRFTAAHELDPMARATSSCVEPNDVACRSCQSSDANDPGSATFDPVCRKDGKVATLPNDNANVRFARMKERFGYDPRFPIERYVDGFQSYTVPSREEEHRRISADTYGEYEKGPGSCTNPLFAESLPNSSAEELCKRPLSGRTPDQVFFALIGGVPWQLLVEGAGDDPAKVSPRAPFKQMLDAADWRRLLGASPETYDESGQNIFMRESIARRPGIAPDNPVNRGEWDTKLAGVGDHDLQFACAFDLPPELVRDCTSPSDGACACAQNGVAGKESDSPLCDGTNRLKQIRAKAYPTLRQLQVAHRLKNQALVASICPRNLTDDETPEGRMTYGYRPAVSGIVNRLRTALNQCIPQPLVAPEGGEEVPCVVFEQLGQPGPEEDCIDPSVPAERSRSIPSPGLLADYRASRRTIVGEARATEEEKFPVCILPQIKRADFSGSSCEESDRPGWCYLTRDMPGVDIGVCQQAIKLSHSRRGESSKVSIRCFEKSAN